MKYADAVAFRTTLDARLKTAAEGESISVGRLRKTVALERFLARLLAVAPNGWLIKGGVALELRLPARAGHKGSRPLASRQRSGSDE